MEAQNHRIYAKLRGMRKSRRANGLGDCKQNPENLIVVSTYAAKTYARPPGLLRNRNIKLPLRSYSEG